MSTTATALAPILEKISPILAAAPTTSFSQSLPASTELWVLCARWQRLALDFEAKAVAALSGTSL